ncbi:MAG: M23 family metallopeptidase [Bacteroidales bacterium]|jgi:murein DD-endopeptidase MepM/ murein hydrolase activator NlpD|nr:M23 family metallopeptidase [Bacteroidales bacterium]
MDQNKNRKTFFQKLRHKYRLSVYRDETYEEVLNLRLSRMNVLAWGGLTVFLFLAIVISIIVYTPVREFIPGYPDENTIRYSLANKQRLDSLDIELARRDLYIENINRIVSGKEPKNYDNLGDTNVNYDNINFSRSVEDSLLREYFEQENKFSIHNNGSKRPLKGISQVHFFPPVKGLVTNSFNTVKNHYGTDIVAGSNEIVKSTLDGTVIMASWTLETGWVIQIQHENNLISVYKHNAELLKRVGDYVKVGEPIAIIGNSGELTTGPHLHFELWYNGIPLNPEDYISF